jgi:hypothetical protein
VQKEAFKVVSRSFKINRQRLGQISSAFESGTPSRFGRIANGSHHCRDSEISDGHGTQPPTEGEGEIYHLL